MCDQTEVSYLEDDVVWVKIGPIWWPGVVKDLEKTDEGKEILASLKKKPIAVVKFFQEDNFEFVKNLEHIYHYSCRRKDEFIKKGLDKFRTGAPHMKKFPADVTTAESLTNGDINIINDPKFFPEKKESYSEIFGSGKKKTKKDSELPSRQRVKQANVTPYRPITHQRFINKALHGESDHKVKTLIQCNSSSDDGATGKPYKCHICKFETSRVNVIVAHHRLSHSNKNSISWTGSDSRLVRRKPIYKSRKAKSKKLFESFKEDESEEEELEKSKSNKSKNFKEKTKSEPSTPASKRKGRDSALYVSDSKKPRYTDVLLADWNEDEEDDKKGSGCEDKEKNEEEEEKESKDENVPESGEQTENPDPSRTRKNQNEKMSCFDFDEEEEGFIGMSNANTYGRKIPRVIPVKDKPELGMDLEIEELFKKKSESEFESSQEESSKNDETKEDSKTTPEIESGEAKEKEDNENPSSVKGPGRRRRSKASKEEELKASSEDSLAMRRTRRPGAKKSYLNEVIEKVVDEDVPPDYEKKVSESNKTEIKVQTREEGGSSSRRKQDLKQTMDSIKKNYPEVISDEQNAISEQEKKNKSHSKDSRGRASDDLTAEIDSLLEETKVPSLPEKADKTEENKQTNFSFDYVPSEGVGKKVAKTSKEVKSISRMFSDCLPVIENVSELDVVVPQESVEEEEGKDSTEEKTGEVSQGKNLKFSPGTQKRGSIVLSSGKDCIVLSRSKILKPAEETEQNSETEANRPKNIKAIKVKSDSLPPLIAAGKLKGQTIIHQKGGKYVIVTQSPPLARQKASRGKVQSGSKVVILRNQLGEQKIMTTSGLQQAKFKVDGQKITASSEVVPDKEASTSDSSAAVGQAQPVIKMVPDGKGGIMKQLTVSPKKVLLGSTKVLVSASGSTFSTGNNVQKITFSGGGGVGRAAGGDFRLIENYKGNGKAVLIHSGLNEGSGVLKTAAGIPRQVTKVIKRPQTIPALKKKPKILLRAATSQDEYVIEQESPTFFVKQDSSTQKFVSQPKATEPGKKTFFISGQTANKKGESYILTSEEAVSGKVIRMRQKIKEIEVPGQKVQKTIQKSPETFTLSQGKIEDRRTIQIQEKTQKPALRTQVIAMPTPLGAGGNQTYVLVSVNENDPTQDLSNSIVGYSTTGQGEPIFVNPTSTGNLILINPKTTKEVTPVYSTSSQDILAKALANTNVLEGAMGNEMDSVVPSILLPPSIPSSVVQETSITLQKPIMTPLEMPTSVAPDTSGLEPPPLPPTPTEEDVLMEETETTAIQVQVQEQREEETSSTDAIQTYLKQESFDHLKPAEPSFQGGEDRGDCDGKITEDYNSVEMNQKVAVKLQHLPHEEFTIENSQEQTTTTFQSLPELNDEPDTSERGVVPIGEEQFEVEKSVADSKQFSQLLRGQEPSSSTNKESKRFEGYLQSEESGNYENYPKSNESEERLEEEEEVQKEKESAGESHSMPVIEEENNANSFEIDPMYSGEITQKRFEEETEVSSTTDEFSNRTVKH